MQSLNKVKKILCLSIPVVVLVVMGAIIVINYIEPIVDESLRIKLATFVAIGICLPLIKYIEWAKVKYNSNK